MSKHMFDVSHFTPIPRNLIMKLHGETSTQEKEIPTNFGLVPSYSDNGNNSYSDNGTNVGGTNQYIQELQFAPLSPKSHKVDRDKPPKVVVNTIKNKVKNNNVKTEPCCICYDEEIPTTKSLFCSHSVCGDCVSQLQKPTCPVCQKFLKGPLVSDDILARIINREEQDRLKEVSRNYLIGMYLEEHREVKPEEAYDLYM